MWRVRHAVALTALAVPALAPIAGAGGQPPALPAGIVVSGDAIAAPLTGRPGDAARGRSIVLDRRVGNCLICHRAPVEGEAFQGDLGPDLAGVASRLGEGQIRLRLVDQSRINPATMMPPFHRTEGLRRVAERYRDMPVLTAGEIEDVEIIGQHPALGVGKLHRGGDMVQPVPKNIRAVLLGHHKDRAGFEDTASIEGSSENDVGAFPHVPRSLAPPADRIFLSAGNGVEVIDDKFRLRWGHRKTVANARGVRVEGPHGRLLVRRGVGRRGRRRGLDSIKVVVCGRIVAQRLGDRPPQIGLVVIPLCTIER